MRKFHKSYKNYGIESMNFIRFVELLQAISKLRLISP